MEFSGEMFILSPEERGSGRERGPTTVSNQIKFISIYLKEEAEEAEVLLLSHLKFIF